MIDDKSSAVHEYLKRGIVSLFEDNFFYLPDLDSKVQTIKYVVDDALSEIYVGAYYGAIRSKVLEVIYDILSAANKVEPEGSLLSLGKGSLNLSRWHQPALDYDPEIFTKLDKRRKNVHELLPIHLQHGFIAAEEIKPHLDKFTTLVYQPEHIRLRHTYIVGKSGYGKTTAIVNMAIQDAQNGSGLCIIAPDTDIFHDFFPHIPPSRIKDVVYINPADEDCSISLNPLHVHEGENIERKADEVYSIFKRLFGFPDVSRLSELLSQVIRALVEVPGATFKDIEKLLDRENVHYRKRVISELKDENKKDFWDAKYDAQFQKGSENPIIYRFNKFTEGKVISGLLCNPNNVFSIRKAMDAKKIICVNLSDGLLGPENAQMLGSLFIALFQIAGMSRADIAQSERENCFLYVDEFQQYTDKSEKAINEILSRARKYGVGIVMAHQYLTQIPATVFNAVVGNCSTQISFFVDSTDARKLAQSGLGSAHKIGRLNTGQAVALVGRNLSYVTTPPPKKGGNKGQIQEIIERSRRGSGTPNQKQASEQTPIDDKRQSPVDLGDPGKLF